MSKYEVRHVGLSNYRVHDSAGEIRAEATSFYMAEFYARMLDTADAVEATRVSQPALRKIANLLDGVEWNSGMLDTIAAICEEAGYQVRDIQDVG